MEGALYYHEDEYQEQHQNYEDVVIPPYKPSNVTSQEPFQQTYGDMKVFRGVDFEYAQSIPNRNYGTLYEAFSILSAVDTDW